MRARHVVAGAGLYLAVAGSTYAWIKSKNDGPGGGGGGGAGGGDAAAAAADAAALLGARGPREAASATARRFSALSRVYDDTVGSEERWMLYGLLRSSLLSDVKGDVLEIGAGTGRNLPHYRWPGVSSLTLVDASAAMLRRAEAKFYDEERVGYRHPHVKARFCVGDAEDLVAGPGEAPRAPPLPRVAAAAAVPAAPARAAAGAAAEDGGGGAFAQLWRTPAAKQEHEEQQQPPPLAPRPPPPALSAAASHPQRQQKQQRQPPPPPPPPPPPAAAAAAAAPGAKFAPGSFDVVVDTFGLCSVEDPVRALEQAARLVKPGTGRVLLLEHGRASALWSWLLDERMDAAAARHKTKWGCWFNRDVAAAVRASGMRVVTERRWHFGTTYVYELAPAAAGGEAGELGARTTGGAAAGRDEALAAAGAASR